MARAGKPQGSSSITMGTKKGRGTARSNSDLPPPPFKAIMFSPSEGLQTPS